MANFGQMADGSLSAESESVRAAKALLKKRVPRFVDPS